MAAGIGHNRGPGFGGRRHAWAKARRDLTPARVPVEIVRIRVRRAARLGLSYPQYAAILLRSGRDIMGFLFTTDGMQAQLRRELRLDADVAAKLRALSGAERLALCPAEEPPAPFRAELEAAAGAPFAAVAPAPGPATSWTGTRAAIRAAFSPLNLPADAVVMIGDGAAEEAWAGAAALASFLPAKDYFGRPRVSGFVDSARPRA